MKTNVGSATMPLTTNCRVHNQTIKLGKCKGRRGHSECPANDKMPTAERTIEYFMVKPRSGSVLPLVTSGRTI